jgi:Beta-propeller repeat
MRLVSMFFCTVCAAAPNVPVFFVANSGQAPNSVRFIAKGSEVTAYLLPREIQLCALRTRIRVQFPGANPSATLEGATRLPGRANFLIGDASRWQRDLPTFAAVRYRNLYRGIDMIYGSAGPRLKSEFIVAPGADAGQIRIRYRGAGVPAVQPDGSLSLVAGDRRLTEGAPYIYQELGSVKASVEGRYSIHRDGSVGFALGYYDPARPLIIDPLMTYSTLVGTNNFNAATAIAVDSAGAAYIAGYTDSDALPTANPAQNFNLGSVQVFVAKLNPAGNSLEYCTYMGGSNDDRAYGIAVDSSGSAYVTGTTTSPNFPTRNAEQSSLAGSRNAFVFKLNSLGDMLEFSTFLGGSGADTAYAIAIDSSGNSYIVGDTTSLNFPASGYQTSNRGSQDAFIAKLSPTGQQLVFATYLGGGGTDHGGAIAVDSGGTVYVTGYTWSSNFPTESPFQSGIAGQCNAFVARISANGNSLLFSTYLGGSGCTMAYPETGQGIAVDAQGNAYIAGVTSSVDFPTRNALQSQLQGSTDVFVAKFNSAGALMFSTYMGGSGVDVGNAIALDASGAIYVAGYTYSTDFPVTAGAIQLTNAGTCDAFLFKLNPAGDQLLYATYLGGSGDDTASGVAIDSRGNVYLGGWTLSANFPGARPGS